MENFFDSFSILKLPIPCIARLHKFHLGRTQSPLYLGVDINVQRECMLPLFFPQNLIRSCPLQEVTSLTIPNLSFSTLHNFVSLLYGCSLSDVQLPDLEELLDLTKILHIETLAHKLMCFIYGNKPSVHGKCFKL